MGKFSRDKGSRVERLLRDVLRGQGYEADRVPLSGAAQGFKGDVRFSKLGVQNGRQFTAEVKARKASFKSIYDVFNQNTPGEENAYRFVADGILVTISDSFEPTQKGGTFMPRTLDKTTRRILNLRRLKGDSDVLVIKDDREPFLFISYRSL